MPLFGSKDDKSHRVQVLTLDYVVEGTAESRSCPRTSTPALIACAARCLPPTTIPR